MKEKTGKIKLTYGEYIELMRHVLMLSRVALVLCNITNSKYVLNILDETIKDKSLQTNWDNKDEAWLFLDEHLSPMFDTIFENLRHTLRRYAKKQLRHIALCDIPDVLENMLSTAIKTHEQREIKHKQKVIP